MSVGLITSEIFKKHDTDTHPENSSRLEAIFSLLQTSELWKKTEKILPQKITEENLYRIHSPEYVSSVIDFCQKGGGRIDEDTVTSLQSYEVALHAAGSVLQAVDLVMQKQFKKIFCLVRPPGHHAIPKSSMGFCLFNNLSLGAIYALTKYNLERILILDWDAHHGNGTEKIFYDNKNVFTVSWHQENFWPFTGKYQDFGTEKGLGYNLNIPIPEGFTDQIFVETFEELVVPVIKSYRPQLIMLAAGYDAHWQDKLAGLKATSALYPYLTKRIISLAQEFCEGRLIATLEGGYTLSSLAQGVFDTLNLLVYPDANLKETFSREEEKNQPKIRNLIETLANDHPFFK